MPKKKKPAQPEEEVGRVIFVTNRLQKQSLKDNEIIVRLPFPRESKWSIADLNLTDKGKGIVGGVDFESFGESIKTEIDEEVLKAIRLNQLQVVVGRIK